MRCLPEHVSSVTARRPHLVGAWGRQPCRPRVHGEAARWSHQLCRLGGVRVIRLSTPCRPPSPNREGDTAWRAFGAGAASARRPPSPGCRLRRHGCRERAATQATLPPPPPKGDTAVQAALTHRGWHGRAWAVLSHKGRDEHGGLTGAPPAAWGRVPVGSRAPTGSGGHWRSSGGRPGGGRCRPTGIRLHGALGPVLLHSCRAGPGPRAYGRHGVSGRTAVEGVGGAGPSARRGGTAL